MISIFIVFAIFILFFINQLTNTLCIQKEMSEEHQRMVFRIINVLITILLVTSYMELLFS